jgi:hypothetical protein
LNGEPPKDLKKLYARFYARATCSWIDSVQRTHPKLIVILYTSPSVWEEYLSQTSEADCLRNLIIWVAYYHRAGGEQAKNIQQMCTASGAGNRCLIHQYTARGMVAGMGRPGKGQDPFHIDLNRFFDARVIPNKRVTFVRAVNESVPKTKLLSSYSYCAQRVAAGCNRRERAPLSIRVP